ncbi:MAG: CvpA family protein [Bacteroidota bacterium]
MNVIDIIFGGLILFAAIRGFMKGFFLEVASLVALILGIYGAIHFSYIAGDYLSSKVSWKESSVHLVAFIITFIVIILVITLVGKLLTKIADLVALGILNKLLGGVFGAFKMILILGVILAFFERAAGSVFFVKRETTEKSVLYHPVKGVGEFVFSWVLRDRKDTNSDA